MQISSALASKGDLRTACAVLISANRAFAPLTLRAFCRIVTECDHADLVAPGIDNYLTRYLNRFLPPHDSHVQRDFNRLVNGVRKGLGLKNAPTIERVVLDQNYDLFFFVAWVRKVSLSSRASEIGAVGARSP
jgi:hypothetical protein